mgnify:CR=1 FL=1
MTFISLVLYGKNGFKTKLDYSVNMDTAYIGSIHCKFLHSNGNNIFPPPQGSTADFRATVLDIEAVYVSDGGNFVRNLKSGLKED